MYFANQIGKKKAKALRDTFCKINSNTKIDTRTVKLNKKNIPLIFKDVDILIEALDKASEKSRLITVFKKYFPQRPIVCASGLAGDGSANTIKTRKLSKRIWIVGDVKSEARNGTVLLCSRVAIAAYHQVNQVVRIIIKER